MEIGSEETINYNTKPTLIKAIIKKDRYLGEVTLAKKITALPFHPPHPPIPLVPVVCRYRFSKNNFVIISV